MRRLHALLALGAWLLLAACVAERSVTPASHAPLSLPEARRAVAGYYQSGRYDADVQALAQEAVRYLEQRKQRQEGKTPAVVFDVDDTLLSSFRVLEAEGFALNASGLEALRNAQVLASLPAVKPMRELLYFAARNGYAVFLVSERPEEMRFSTLENLSREGLVGWFRLYLRPPGSEKQSTSEYKVMVRNALSEGGFDILAVVGDQDSDFSGGATGRAFRLPNPMYSAP